MTYSMFLLHPKDLYLIQIADCMERTTSLCIFLNTNVRNKSDGFPCIKPVTETNWLRRCNKIM